MEGQLLLRCGAAALGVVLHVPVVQHGSGMRRPPHARDMGGAAAAVRVVAGLRRLRLCPPALLMSACQT